MADTRIFLRFCVGMCLVSLVLSAAMEYEEPDMEVSTATGSGADANGGSGDMDDKEQGSGDKDDGSGNKDDGSGDMDDGSGDKDDGSGDKDDGSGDKDDGSGDKDDGSGQSSEDAEMMDEARMKKKLNDVSEEGSGDSGSSSSEEGGSSSSEEEAGKDTKCTGGSSLDALMSGVGKDSDKDCQVAVTLKAMVEFLSTMSEDINALKEQVTKTCSGGAADKTAEDDGSGSGDGEEDAMEGSGEDDKKKDCDHEKDDGDDSDESTSDSDVTTTPEPTTTPAPTLPPPPTSCPSPFQLLASGCFYIQTNSREWRSWGEAQAFCQQQGGHLAAPVRPQELRDYLQQSYSSTIWVGARFVDSKWMWLNGNEMVAEDWKQGKPSAHRAKRCVYLDSWSSYRGVNHYCGEKFSFACEHSGM